VETAPAEQVKAALQQLEMMQLRDEMKEALGI
jgi:hypothetical protein